MKITVNEKAGTLTIVADLASDPQPSGTGKSLMLVSSHGPMRTDQTVGGKPLTVNLNAYVKA